MAEVLLIAALAAVGWTIRAALERRRHDAAVLAVVQTFAAARADVEKDPRSLLTWQPLAESTRTIFPAAFAALDAATGSRFPFSKQQIEETHARITSEWLAWEQAHDEEYRIKAAAAEQEMNAASGEGATLRRARLDRIQHEKIARYQQRYEEYARTSKALQALLQ